MSEQLSSLFSQKIRLFENFFRRTLPFFLISGSRFSRTIEFSRIIALYSAVSCETIGSRTFCIRKFSRSSPSTGTSWAACIRNPRCSKKPGCPGSLHPQELFPLPPGCCHTPALALCRCVEAVQIPTRFEVCKPQQTAFLLGYQRITGQQALRRDGFRPTCPGRQLRSGVISLTDCLNTLPEPRLRRAAPWQPPENPCGKTKTPRKIRGAFYLFLSHPTSAFREGGVCGGNRRFPTTFEWSEAKREYRPQASACTASRCGRRPRGACGGTMGSYHI